MKISRCLVFLIASIIVTVPFANATDVSGNVSGTWYQSQSPYNVTGDLTLLAEDTLVIEPGVRVEFTGAYQFAVMGTLQAVGTQTDSIYFTTDTLLYPSRWRRLSFSNGSSSSALSYCVIEYSNYGYWGGGVYCESSSPFFSHCTIRRNIAGGSGGGVFFKDSSSPVLTDCYITDNRAPDGGGITVLSSSPLFVKCVISRNAATTTLGGGVACMGSPTAPLFTNSTIVHNASVTGGAGVYCSESAMATLVNCIVWANSGSGDQASGYITYSDIQGGYSGTGNIDTDPMFVDTANGDFHLQWGSPCIDAGDPSSPYDPDGTIADIGAFYFHQCAPTELPFIDNFDSPELDSCWFWIREDTSHWSLTERPGWMRLKTLSHDGNNYERNILSRDIPDTSFAIETMIEFVPGTSSYAQLYIGMNDNLNEVNISRQPIGKIRSHSWVNGIPQYQDLDEEWNPIHLKIIKQGVTYTTFASPDGCEWTQIAVWNRLFDHDGLITVGIKAGDYTGSDLRNADFDYFSVDPLTGTSVCGDVSGIWDSTGSPYYVTCDVNVPTGQTLEIQPGVDVLFTGHYKFNVYGNIQAIGNEEDSIVFTRAFPTEESKWAGIRINSSTDTCSFIYCLIEYGKATGSGPNDDWGGAICNCGGAPLEILYCTLQNNYATDDGGAVVIQSSSYSRILNSIFTNNFASDEGGSAGAGGLEVNYSSNVLVSNCLFANNYSNGNGGALVSVYATITVRSSTFVNNHCDGSGSAIYSRLYSETPISNSIIWGNNNTQIDNLSSSVNVAYSDIEGGYPGIGNIDSDPMFVDTANGDFHLQWNSPCIDTGDPSSPLDPDGSRADMGAFPYQLLGIRIIYPNGGENLTLWDSTEVHWIGTGFVGNVMIEINHDYPEGDWDTLAYDTQNDSVETIFVDEPISDNCRIRITSIDEFYSDISDADFSIVTSQGYLALVRTAQPTTTVLSWNAGILECPNAALETFRLKNFGGAPIVVYRPDEPASDVFSRVSACPTSFSLVAGEMSSCDVTISFTPEADGTYRDSLRIRTNGSNGTDGALWIPLTGTQITTPATAEVVITINDEDACLIWNPITESIGNCEIEIARYLVFYSPTAGGPFYYHGWTSDTTYTHIGVVTYASGMFYHVYAVIAPPEFFASLPALGDRERMLETEILDLLHQSRTLSRAK